MGVSEPKILLLGVSKTTVYYDRIDFNSELLIRLSRRIFSLRKKQLLYAGSSKREILSEKFLAGEVFTGVDALVFIIESILFHGFSGSEAKFYFDLSLQRLDQYSPNASVFIFNSQAKFPSTVQGNTLKKMEKEMILKTYLAGIERHVYYSCDIQEIVQKIREIG